MSAYADGYQGKLNDSCAAITLAGTSMAAPGVAGAAAIVRQYFEEGFHPTGEVKAMGQQSSGQHSNLPYISPSCEQLSVPEISLQ